MVYVFEDCKTSMLSQFFEKAYPPEVVANFHYARSNSKILAYITAHFDRQEKIAVCLDMMPGNRNLRDHYYELADLVPLYPNLRVFPIMCKEYYLLKALRGTCCVRNSNWVDTCLDFGVPSDTSPSILETDDERRYCTTMERFSKLTARKALTQCARIGRLSDHESGERPYYEQDCICSAGLSTAICVPIFMREKSNRYVRQFGVFPSGSCVPDVVGITWEGTIAAHRLLVDAYNCLSEKLSMSDRPGKDQFDSIDYIHG